MYLIFENTCYACPEQYDVFDIEDDEENKKQVAYIRLRWGRITCTVPDVGGDIVYDHSFEEEYKGLFSSEDERSHHLNLIRKAIIKYYQNEYSI
jgi:hypothetical protein